MLLEILEILIIKNGHNNPNLSIPSCPWTPKLWINPTVLSQHYLVPRSEVCFREASKVGASWSRSVDDTSYRGSSRTSTTITKWLAMPLMTNLGYPLPPLTWPILVFKYIQAAFSSFSWMRSCSKGSRFTLGVWGLRVCSLDVAQPSAAVRNRPQPFAFVRNRPQPSARAPYGRAYGEFCNRGRFWRLRMLRFAWQAWHVVTFRRVLWRVESRFVWQAQYFCDVFRRGVSFCGRRSTVDASIIILPRRRNTLDVSCCVFFCESQSQGCVKWRKDANSVAGVTLKEYCDLMKMDGSLARNIDFEVVNLEVHKKTRRITSIVKLLGRSLARNARFDAPTSLVSSLWFSCGLAPCLWGKLQSLSFSKVSIVMSFCEAGAGTLWHSNLFDNVSKVVLCGKHASFSQDKLQFSWQAHHFGDLWRHFARQAQHFRRVALRALHSTLHPLHFTLHTLHSTLHTLHFTLHTLHSTLYTPRFIRDTLHSTLYTLHFILYNPHFTLYTL